MNVVQEAHVPLWPILNYIRPCARTAETSQQTVSHSPIARPTSSHSRISTGQRWSAFLALLTEAYRALTSAGARHPLARRRPKAGFPRAYVRRATRGIRIPFGPVPLGQADDIAVRSLARLLARDRSANRCAIAGETWNSLSNTSRQGTHLRKSSTTHTPSSTRLQ